MATTSNYTVGYASFSSDYINLQSFTVRPRSSVEPSSLIVSSQSLLCLFLKAFQAGLQKENKNPKSEFQLEIQRR